MADTIRDMQGNVIGYQERDGTLRDQNKKKVGTYNKRDGTVRDNQNQEVGFIDKEGTVIDRYRRRVGSISSDGVVQDWHGIPLYTGSGAPLLLDFDAAKNAAAESERMDFEQMARQDTTSGAEFQERARAKPTEGSRRSFAGALMQEGFVSPSAIGCLGLVGAFVVGGIIIFLFQNPSFLPGASRTPTAALVAAATPSLDAAAKTPDGAAQPTAAATLDQATGKGNTKILNLRQGPGTTFEVVDRLQMNDEVVIKGRLSDSTWLKVTVPGISKDGWVATQYIDTEVDIANLPVVEATTP